MSLQLGAGLAETKKMLRDFGAIPVVLNNLQSKN